MATVNQIHGTYSKYNTVLTVNQGQQNILANSTTISYSLVTSFSGGSGAYANQDSSGASFSVTINGKVVASGKKAYNFNSSRTKTWTSGSLTIPHNTDGKKTLSFSFSFTGNSSYLGNASGSSSMTLTTIARATSFTLSTSNLTMNNEMTVNLNPATSSFSHVIYLKYGSKGYTSVANLSSGVKTAKFTPKTDVWASANTNSASGVATVMVRTISGSATIGETSKTFTLTIPSNIVPTVNHTVTLVNGLNGQYIKGFSSAKIVNTASGTLGSSFRGFTTKITQENILLQSSNQQIFNTNVFNAAGDVTINTEATDSRGRKAQIKTVVNVKDYNYPSLTNIKVYRSNASGLVQDDGSYATIEADVHIYNISGNVGSLKIRSRTKTLDNSSYYSDIKTISNLTGTSTQKLTVPASTEEEYEFELFVKDSLSDSTYYNSISTASVTIDFYKTGNGIAIGKVASKDYLIDIDRSWAILGSSPYELYTENLDDVLDMGVYIQTQTSRANTNLNYPINSAGFLEVISRYGTTYAYVIQRYTQYQSKSVWIRSKYMNNWSEWDLVSGTIDITSSILATNEGNVTVVHAYQTPNYVSLELKWDAKTTGWFNICGVTIPPAMGTIVNIRQGGSPDMTSKIINGRLFENGKLQVWNQAAHANSINISVIYPYLTKYQF
ncbi:hypothetical protein GUI37_05930 [Helcococcus kunzii]|uniref:DUF859 family phage minor structural protein n=1 Tax=Helcococcus kunzii TaxID=40091 RepID=UPI001BAF550F|nr:DUF859 family phage minor structural protein [Helcococcus kunzii]QUY65078.1 hypothetical protein GUI37_05930 [Helcococcus kunzii]